MFVDPTTHLINGCLLVGQGVFIVLLLIKLRRKDHLIDELRRSLSIMQTRNRDMLSRVLESALHTERTLDDALQSPTTEATESPHHDREDPR